MAPAQKSVEMANALSSFVMMVTTSMVMAVQAPAKLSLDSTAVVVRQPAKTLALLLFPPGQLSALEEKFICLERLLLATDSTTSPQSCSKMVAHFALRF